MTKLEEKKTARTQLTREDWARAAIEIMIDSSVEQVRVEAIARELDVSKGSFYWHFRNRDDLLELVLEIWTQEATVSVDERVLRRAANPAERLLLFLRLPLSSKRASKASDLELAILGWARRSRMAEDAVATVDRLRVDQLTRQFDQLGFAPEQAEFRAHTTYAFLRYIAQRRDLPAPKKLEMTAALHRQLLHDAAQ
jgi:AcrR family transcriptional regulator